MIDLALLAAGGQILKDTHAAFKKVQEIKQNSELCDLLEKILDLRQTVLDAKEEIIDLREKLSEVNKRQDIESRLKFDSRRGVYFLDNDKECHAYCPKCWPENSRLVPLRKGIAGYACSSCGNGYPDPDYKAPEVKRVSSVNPYTKRERW